MAFTMKTYKITGIVHIGDDNQAVDSPTFKLINSSFDPDTAKCTATVQYTEVTEPNQLDRKYVRQYSFDSTGSWSWGDVRDAVLGLDRHNGYVEV